MIGAIFDFWGKAEREGSRWHPAVCHMLDTGIVARELLALQPDAVRGRFMTLIDGNEKDALNTIALIAALHDLGKISPGFQAKRDDLCASLRGREFPFSGASEEWHSLVILETLPDILIQELDCGPEGSWAIAHVLAAHHGAFQEAKEASCGTGPWKQARKEAVNFLAGCFDVQTLQSLCLPSLPDLFLLAGLISVADWIASAEEVFGYSNGQPADVTAYISERRNTASSLLKKLKTGAVVQKVPPFFDLFGFHPNSCQNAALEVASELKHPMLLVVETPMGSGKTEAAQAAYASVASREGLRGMYCALPTQATGNAMFERMEKFLARLHGDSGAELHLLHANSDIHPSYTALKVAGIESDETGKGGSITASSWFCARKRGLLAGYGAGTVDQALLSILKVRHFFVRLFGLSGKVIVLDEVHAYDAYMSQEIRSLIGWAARCGSSVFLLSATLPASKREALIKAFSPDAEAPTEATYPCVLGIDHDSGRAFRKVDVPKSTLEIVPVVVSQTEKLGRMAKLAQEQIVDGGCVACIVNTVAEAQELYRTLKEVVPDCDLLLFHSQFTLERRLEIEQETLGKYGKGGTRPARGVVVATQVIEQSLDLDFDLMLTDVAPIDLLLQRAGRLHRHDRLRPSALKTRRLFVTIPDLVSDPDFGGSGKVYFPDVLLKTALLFRGGGNSLTISIPDGVSELIEEVYVDAEGLPLEQLEEKLQAWSGERIGKEQAQEFFARSVALPDAHTYFDQPDYLGRIANERDEEAVLSTRDAMPSITLVILEEGERITVGGREDARRLYLKSLATSRPLLYRKLTEMTPPSEWKESPLLRHSRTVFFRDGRSVMEDVTLMYDAEFGLRIIKGGRK